MHGGSPEEEFCRKTMDAVDNEQEATVAKN
jgi:hypothetical protein